MSTNPAAISKKELFLRACRGDALPRVPVWMMRQAGRYLPEYRELRAKHAFLEVCKTPELAVEVSLQPFRRLGVDAIIVFSDILIVAEAMGLPLELGDAGPNLPSPVRTAADVSKLNEFDPETETRFLMDALRMLSREAGAEVPVLGFAAAPWTLACYMVEGRTKEGFAATKSFLSREPRVFRDLLHRIAQATIGYLKAQIAAGASTVQLFDTWCGELALPEYESFALPAVQEIIREVIGLAPVIYYTKASHHLLTAVVESGANVLSVDWRVNLAELRKLAGPRVGIQGNLDPALLYAPPDVLRAKTAEIVQQLGGAGHILNLGHGILPTTPVENAQLFIHTGQEATFAASTTTSATIVR
ncbi:MAG TPA: uroporphyrinogen decarboxylase [Candidatus Acidoferrum sp.]|nr:uroporphyrinogen decarboxylase [Candidatus Acidoferrum sp.]